MLTWLQTILQANKAVVSAAGVAATALTLTHDLFGSNNTTFGVIFAVLTPFLTWLIPNKSAAK